jgi:hypothetical protein
MQSTTWSSLKKIKEDIENDIMRYKVNVNQKKQ